VNQASSRGDAPTSPGEEPPRGPEWDGQPLATEGEVALVVLGALPTPDEAFPTPVIAAARAGDTTCLVRPAQIAAFLRAHAGAKIVCEQSGVFHGMLEAHLKRQGEELARLCLWELSGSGRLLDVILLDQLIDMAELGVEKNPSRLDVIAKDRCDLEIQDQRAVQAMADAHAGRLPGSPDPMLEVAAVAAVEALMKVYRYLSPRAEAIKDPQGWCKDLDEEVGPLSLGIQVRGAIALERMTRVGGLRVEAAKDAIECCEEAFRECSGRLREDRKAWGCFHKLEQEIRVDKEGLPQVYGDRLVAWLEQCVNAIQGVHGLPFRPPLSAPGRIARSSNLWGELACYHPGLAAWERLETAALARAVLREAQQRHSGLVRPNYQALPRIRSAKPNLTTLRKLSPGPIFAAPAGRGLLVGELCDLELRCLADRDLEEPDLGSTLAGTFRAGRDPTRYAAAALYCRHEFRSGGQFHGNFDALERDAPNVFQAWMTVARMVLHLAPRRLAPELIARLIEEELGEENGTIPASEISRACPTVVNEIFPEIMWLRLQQTMIYLNERLSRGVKDSFTELKFSDERLNHLLRDLIRGRRSDALPLDRLRELWKDSESRGQLRHRSQALYEEIFCISRRTGFGRVRGKMEVHLFEFVHYLDGPDDIRKTVLYELVAAGYELAAFAGDEFVLLAPAGLEGGASGTEQAIRDVENLVEKVLARFLTCVPGRCRVVARPAW
jgi:hypothetical protein